MYFKFGCVNYISYSLPNKVDEEALQGEDEDAAASKRKNAEARAKIKEKAAKLLREARKIAINWVKKLREISNQSTDDEEMQKLCERNDFLDVNCISMTIKE
jgi:hypothetical protein